jgi:hypothetical protein
MICLLCQKQQIVLDLYALCGDKRRAFLPQAKNLLTPVVEPRTSGVLLGLQAEGRLGILNVQLQMFLTRAKTRICRPVNYR